MGGGVETSEPTEGGVDTQEYGVGAAEDTRSAAGEEQKQRRKGAVVQSVLGEEEESAPIKRFQSESVNVLLPVRTGTVVETGCFNTKTIYYVVLD